MNGLLSRRAEMWVLWGAVVALSAGCAASRPPARSAPVEDRRVTPTASAPLPAPAPQPSPSAGATPAPAAPVAPPPGQDNAGKPGYYTVRPGDTLYRIGLEHGQSWRDLAAWNNLPNPDRIEVGQVLRVAPPGGEPQAAGGAITQPVTTAPVQPRPLPSEPPAPPAATPAPLPPAAAAPANVARPASPPSPAPAADAISLIWPARGPILYHFDEVRQKGIGIGGKAGDPVVAAADGRVVYAGSDLRGYGNLIIIKHNNTYLTAYAHNQSLLVREDQTVRQGQKIAEMGSSDADRVKLHFEVRRQGKPVDPLSLLPSR
ncbi:Murein hydrolase activator NlpD [Tepidimonas alkaliphilus]|uniref:Murein hydrolase activator NlpD n=1 Tax=Tepidimonas alkaliphilus TaxID=2588942 RepID=A0A554W8C6_9BURK|nr:peptidoglycan DD-metalloendopeptidase family protein [Tepidimonas alkaliphilus]TSE19820.1 Murein hydrolase activator NlpD [Tepidimonas alkaliphilus]